MTSTEAQYSCAARGGQAGPSPRLCLFADSVTAGCTLFVAWAQVGLRSAAFGVTLVVAGSAVAWGLRMPSRLSWLRRAGLFGIALFWIGRLYHPSVRWSPPIAQLARLPAGNVMLALAAFWTLYHLLLTIRPHLRFRCEWPALMAGTAGVLFVTADLFFVSLAPPAKFWRFAYRKYHPYLANDRPGTYYYSHARERIVHDLRGKRFAQKKPEGTVRIVLNGASTMWGARLRPGEASPAQALEECLHESKPDWQVEVLTVACPGKYQMTELIDTVVTLPHWNPGLVVSFNGFNEIWYGEQESFYEGMPYVAPQLEAAIETEPIMAYFWRFTYMGPALWKRWLWTRRSKHQLRDPLAYEPPRYYSYLRLTARNLKEMGVPYVYAFCPNAFERAKRTKEEEEGLGVCFWWEVKSDLGPVARERRRLAAEIVREEGQIPYDPMAVLGAVEETVFIDKCHLTGRGVKLVMQDLAARIPAWLADWRQTHR